MAQKKDDEAAAAAPTRVSARAKTAQVPQEPPGHGGKKQLQGRGAAAAKPKAKAPASKRKATAKSAPVPSRKKKPAPAAKSAPPGVIYGLILSTHTVGRNMYAFALIAEVACV